MNSTVILIVAIVFPVAFLTLWCLVLLLLSRISGWNRLARSYSREQTRTAQDGQAYRWQSGTVGIVGYRNCLHIGVSASGISLAVAWPLNVGHRDLFIPWNALHDRIDKKIFWYQVTRLQVGNPALARLQLPTKVFAASGDKS